MGIEPMSATPSAPSTPCSVFEFTCVASQRHNLPHRAFSVWQHYKKLILCWNLTFVCSSKARRQEYQTYLRYSLKLSEGYSAVGVVAETECMCFSTYFLHSFLTRVHTNRDMLSTQKTSRRNRCAPRHSKNIAHCKKRFYNCQKGRKTLQS